MGDLPWHQGDLAVNLDGWRAVVIEVLDGKPNRWAHIDLLGSRPRSWPADAVPDFADAGTAARWLRSCAEVVPAKRPREASQDEDAAWLAAAFAIHKSPTVDAWTPHDPTLTARAVEATRAYLATHNQEKM